VTPHVRVAIVGAGPAGLAAAAECHAAGTPALLLEERPVLGGRAVVVPGARGLAEGLLRDLRSTEVWRNSPVWGIFGRTLAALRDGRVRTVAADAIITATGAVEQIVPFPGWTLGGVLTVEGAWEGVRGGKMSPASGPAVVVGGADALALAVRLAERGIAVAVTAEERPKTAPEALRVLPPARLARAEGNGSVERVLFADGTAHDCRLLCVESPRAPLVELARLAGAPCVYRPRLGGFVPRYDRTLALHGPVSGLFIAGDAAGLDTPRAAAESGRLAARAALRMLGALPDAEVRIEESWRHLRAAAIPLCARAREAHVIGAAPDDVLESWSGPPETVFCPCTGATARDLEQAVLSGARHADDLKRVTRCGMGVCQWRRCGTAVLRWLSAARQLPMGRLTLPRVRPPIRPVPVSAWAEWRAAPPG
jgi:bacterioferritin-associated ferredoxin